METNQTKNYQNHLPSKAASSPSIGINMHGFRLPLLSDHPPANNIIMIPNTESEKKKKKNISKRTNEFNTRHKVQKRAIVSLVFSYRTAQ